MSVWQDLTTFVSLFPEAALCGTALAVVCSVFGVFVVMRRIVFISIALSEAATCGLALAMVLHISPLAGSSLVTALVVLMLAIPDKRQMLPKDVVLGFAFLLASSASILMVSQSGFGLEEITSMLYGDLIVSGPYERRILLLTGLPSLALLLLFMRPTMYAFLDRDTARVMGIRCWFWEAFFFLLLGSVVSGASKSGGSLLVFCMLVVIPATALMLARRLWAVIAVAVLIAVTITWGGLLAAYRIDLPANSTIITLACVVFAGVAVGSWLIRQLTRLWV